MIKKFIKSNCQLYTIFISANNKIHNFKNTFKYKIKSLRIFDYIKMRDFYNKHTGERCFIIGNGPSLSINDLNKLKDETTFGTNRIYSIFDQTVWRPTYYMAQDFKLILASKDHIKFNGNIIKFLPQIIHEFNGTIHKTKKIIKDRNIITFNFNIEDNYPNKPSFSENANKEIFEGFTITYSAIQLAVYMGFKEIYLLGIDHSYSVEKKADGSIVKNEGIKDYFIDNYMSSDEDLFLPQLDKSTLAYRTAKKYCDENNIKIYNATRGGKLEVFERVNLDNIVK